MISIVIIVGALIVLSRLIVNFLEARNMQMSNINGTMMMVNNDGGGGTPPSS